MTDDGSRRAKGHGPAAQNGRRLLLLGAFILVVTFIGVLSLSRPKAPQALLPESPNRAQAGRIVSLSPGVTETVIALGAGSQLVGVSDYCQLSPRERASRVGSAITPNYEAIAKLAPDLIVTSEVKGGESTPLSRLAPTHALPWLTLKEWANSVLELGRLLGRTDEARKLHREILRTLSVPEKPGAPRVLLVLHYGDTGQNEVWFIRKNSIHGAALEAAGAKNAVSRAITGQPKLSPEELVAVDPDAIIVLHPGDEPAAHETTRQQFAKFSTMRAVTEKQIFIVSAKEALSVGPSLLKLVPLLREIVAGVKSPRSRGHE